MNSKPLYIGLISLCFSACTGTDIVTEPNAEKPKVFPVRVTPQRNLQEIYKQVKPIPRNAINGRPDYISQLRCEGELLKIAEDCNTGVLQSLVSGKGNWVLTKDRSISCSTYVKDYANNKLDFLCR